MNKKIKLFLATIAIITTVVSVTGCGKKSSPKLIVNQEVLQSNYNDKNKEDNQIKSNNKKELDKQFNNKKNNNGTVGGVKKQAQIKKKESCISSHIKDTKIDNDDKNTQIYVENVTVKNPNFHTPWINNSKYSICIDGRGESSIEEGIGTLIVKDLKSNKLSGYVFKNKGFQHTFKQAIFKDDNTILAIAGFAYGAVSKGGHIYSINLLNDEIKEINIPLNKNEEIISIVKSNDTIKGIKQVMDSNNRTEIDITALFKK